MQVKDFLNLRRAMFLGFLWGILTVCFSEIIMALINWQLPTLGKVLFDVVLFVIGGFAYGYIMHRYALKEVKK